MMAAPHRRMYASAFLLDFSVAIGLTAMPFFIFERLGGGPAMSGLIGALQMGLYSLGCLGSAWLVSGRGLGLALAGVTAFIVPFAALPWVTSPTVCALITSLPFLGLALAWPAMQSWIGGEPDPARRARHLTGFNTATSFGFTVSPLLTGPLYDWDFRLPFVALLFSGGLTLLLLRSLPVEGRRDSGADEASPDETHRPVSAGLLYASWSATLVANGLFAALRSVYPSHVEDLVGAGTLTLAFGYRPDWLAAIGPATAFSWLAFILPLATVCTFALLGRNQAWHGRFGWIIAGQVAAALAVALVGQVESLASMLACFAVTGINFGLCFYTSLYYSLADAAHKHKHAAINEGVLGLGGFAGGIGAGQAAGLLGIGGAFLWAPALVLPLLVIQLMLLRRRP